jgi:hypothetical protein
MYRDEAPDNLDLFVGGILETTFDGLFCFVVQYCHKTAIVLYFVILTTEISSMSF